MPHLSLFSPSSANRRSTVGQSGASARWPRLSSMRSAKSPGLSLVWMSCWYCEGRRETHEVAANSEGSWVLSGLHMLCGCTQAEARAVQPQGQLKHVCAGTGSTPDRHTEDGRQVASSSKQTGPTNKDNYATAALRSSSTAFGVYI